MKVIGIDIASRQDHTAGVVFDDWRLSDVRVLPVGVNYPAIHKFIQKACGEADHVVMDGSGVGDAVYQVLRDDCPNLISARFTGGHKAVVDGREWRVAKPFLIQTLNTALNGKRIDIAVQGEGREALRREMVNFQRIGAKRGWMKYEAAPGTHDDILMAAALGVLGLLVFKGRELKAA